MQQIEERPATLRRLRPWQFSLFMLLIVVTGSAVVVWLLLPERPPPPMKTKTELERRVLEIAAAHVKSRATDYRVPIVISFGRASGSYVVTYWTPRKELKLLGPRQVIVTPASGSAEIVMRD